MATQLLVEFALLFLHGQVAVFPPPLPDGSQRPSKPPHGRFLLIKLAGIDSPDQARRWTHATLYVERDEMPALEQDEYYFVDLLGCRVEDEAGSDFGTVADVFASGAHDVMVVREGAREWMLPVLARWVLSIDVAGKQVVVRLPEGLRE